VKLVLDASVGASYTSASQWARRVTEAWASGNLYCVACTAPRLAPHAANRAVEDYHCTRCRRQIQLKAKNGTFAKAWSNSAFEKKRAAIAAGRTPDYCFMSYRRESLLVDDVVWVPGHFITLSVVSPRRPLAATARRSGWIGSTIHLDRVPNNGKIVVVERGKSRPPRKVRLEFHRLAFLQHLDSPRRRWLTDVLAALDHAGIAPGQGFANADLYALEERFHQLHPSNLHIRPKIRQQLQVLQRRGLVTRVSPGRYVRH